ncbi:MAG: hypothetical protein HC853_05105 [Anaerolineae bacterium]|nr:hypothetical protein [Anaerolineae bacterium]
MLANVAAGLITNASIASAGTMALPAQSAAQVAPAQAEATARVAATEQTFLDPAACLLSAWAPFSNTTFVVPQGTVSTQIVVSVTSGSPLDATTAQYTVYTPGGGNSDWTNAGSTQLNDFTVIMTATAAVAPPTNGALSSVQFKVSRKTKGKPTPMRAAQCTTCLRHRASFIYRLSSELVAIRSETSPRLKSRTTPPVLRTLLHRVFATPRASTTKTTFTGSTSS